MVDGISAFSSGNGDKPAWNPSDDKVFSGNESDEISPGHSHKLKKITLRLIRRFSMWLMLLLIPKKLFRLSGLTPSGYAEFQWFFSKLQRYE